MKLSDFDYDLDKSFIAQKPVSTRHNSKLLVYDSLKDKIYHKHFYNIKDYLKKDDILVLNKTKVFPARVLFEQDGKKLEIFLLEHISDDVFLVMTKPSKIFQVGKRFKINDNLFFIVEKITDNNLRFVKFNLSNNNLLEEINKVGKIPLPPYIKNAEKYVSKYQTVYFDNEYCKSVASPTAGLHFTKQLIKELKTQGIIFTDIVLNVGIGTFQPVRTQNLEEHKMHSEKYFMPFETKNILNNRKKTSRIISVGTTTVRVLESNFKDNLFHQEKSETNLFIYPDNYEWKAVDALITNFHLPKSSLLMLVSSFLQHKKVKDPVKKLFEIYEEAKKHNYRFFSFGDSMFIF